MSRSQVLKKLRKEMRKDISKKYTDFYDYAKGLSFWQKMQVTMQILFGKKRKITLNERSSKKWHVEK